MTYATAHNRRLATIVVATVLGMVAAGCSADPPSPVSGPDSGPGPVTGTQTLGTAAVETPDPCALLTLEEISATFGGVWGHAEELPPVELPEGQLRECYYAPSDMATVALGVAITPTDTSRPASDFKKASSSGYIEEFTEVDIPGLGDLAWGNHATDSPDEASIWVVKGALMLNLVPIRIEGTIENLTALAELAVPRMP